MDFSEFHTAFATLTLSFVQIAKHVGGIDWKNVVAGARTIEHRMAEDGKFAAEVEAISELLPVR